MEDDEVLPGEDATKAEGEGESAPRVGSGEVCPGCGDYKPSAEDIDCSRKGLGDPFSDYCWGGIDGRPECPVWQEEYSGRYVRLVTCSEVKVLEALAANLKEVLWSLDRDDHIWDIKVHGGPTGKLGIAVNEWDSFTKKKREALVVYSEGFVAGALAVF
jgi:hypothetical protein